MSIADILYTEPALSLIGAALGGVWTLFKSFELRNRNRSEQYQLAVETLEAAVEQTYRTYVEALKAARSDGKLTKQEKDEARRRAKETAVRFGRSRGVDVLAELSEDCLDLWIAKLVKRLKE